jgi:hypothetical protein
VSPAAIEAFQVWSSAHGGATRADAFTFGYKLRDSETAVVPGNVRERLLDADSLMGCGMYGLAREAVQEALQACHSQVSLRDCTEDASHENGRYECGPCVECGHTFVGHKRRVVCKGCANPVPAQCNPQEPK